MTPTESSQKYMWLYSGFELMDTFDQSTVPIHCAVKLDILSLVIRTSRKVHLNSPPKLGLFNGLFKHVLT